MKMLVLGAGLQGCACAYDLLQNPAVTEVTLADLARNGFRRFYEHGAAGGSARCASTCTDPVAVRRLMRGTTRS